MTDTLPSSGADVRTGEPAVRLSAVGRRFGADYAVRDVSLDIAPGELICLLGASGSGKTTLLRMIAGFDSPTEGAIYLGGVDISHLSPSKREIGMVFQNYALFPTMTVRKNVEYGLKMRGWPAAKRRARAAEMLDRMHLSAFATRYPSQLSGGQQQRVAIARALAYSPKLLLMDEPLGALDKALKQDMLREIAEVHREFGATILYVTHDREEALTLADRVAVMRDSRLVTCEPVEELYLRPPSAYVAEFFTGSNLLPVAVSATGGAVDAAFAGSTLRLVGSLPAAPVVASVRTRDLTLTAAGPAWAVSGVVQRRQFLGDEVLLTVDATATSAGLQLDALLPLAQVDSVAIGDPITVHAPAAAVHLLTDDRGPALPAPAAAASTTPATSEDLSA
jgi:putative spermidine/putrescine transport system ATP-binding protein